ncbi:MAG: sugar transferase [Bacteroidales bacterium]|nr:sugar transferase [Bacteroidales bacterium]
MGKGRIYKILIIDLMILIASIMLAVLFKQGTGNSYLHDYALEFCLLLVIWGFSSFFFGKYATLNKYEIAKAIRTILLSNFFSFALITSIMYITRIVYYSRFVVIGTIVIASVGEIIFTLLSGLFKRPVMYNITGNNYSEIKNGNGISLLNGNILKLRKRQKKVASALAITTRKQALLDEISKNAFDFIFSYASLESENSLIVSTTSRFNIDTQLASAFDSIVNINRINDIRYLNKFFESANAKLPVGGLFIDYVETKDLRKQRILRKFPPVLNYIFYSFDFIIKRVFPKFLLTKKIYFFLTRGQNRVITKAETFGRLYSCGFEIIAEKFIDNHLYFVARKTGKPVFPERPSYGPLVRLERIGKNGKKIVVFKMRTMHPYAEYLQQYVYEKVGLDNGGKFKNDFRISTIGRLMRTFWIDELPMLFNLFKGDLKLVGVRPLSQQYFSLYTKELQERRIKYKPGMIPPFYVDNPQTLEDIMASELRYLEAYEKHPFLTDFKYFFRAVCNILFKRYRSK